MDKTILAYEDHKIECFHQGAHLSSWRYKDREQIFLSKQAIFENGVAIRGGVPICFPQFGAFGPGKKHGFARNVDWTLVNQSESALEFGLTSSEKKQSLWPHIFSARFRIKLEENTLSMTLTVENKSDTSLEFTSALHTYFRVQNIHDIKIKGLGDLEYWDNGTEFSERSIDESAELTISSAIDRVYFNAPNTLKLIEGGHSRQVVSSGFKDVVVWNPWLEGAQGLSDMNDQEYLTMVCIEAANVQTPTQLNPGETWSGSQSIAIL